MSDTTTATASLEGRVRELAREPGLRLGGLFPAPWDGGLTAATDGRALLLHRGITPDPPGGKPVGEALAWVPGEVEHAATFPECDLAALVAFLGKPDPFVRCACCKGRGGCECQCGHLHDCQECHGRGGEGGDERPVWIDGQLVDANRLACWLAAIGADAGRVRVGVTASKPTADHLWASDTGGVWHLCLMPMDPKCVRGDSHPRWEGGAG